VMVSLPHSKVVHRNAKLSKNEVSFEWESTSSLQKLK